MRVALFVYFLIPFIKVFVNAIQLQYGGVVNYARSLQSEIW